MLHNSKGLSDLVMGLTNLRRRYGEEEPGPEIGQADSTLRRGGAPLNDS